MSDLTIIFYTANRISETFARNVRTALLKASVGIPIISVSFEPIDLGRNIAFTPLAGPGAYNIYKQILIGARAASTPYVAMAEDDCLYPREHFDYHPASDDVFYYNKNRWWLEEQGCFRYRDRSGMHTCVVARDLLIQTLEARFKKYPDPTNDRKNLTGWGEPGRYEKYMGLPQVELEYFRTERPLVTFNHKPSLGGLRRTNVSDVIQTELGEWGNASNLWSEIHGQ